MQDNAATILAVDDSVATLEVISRNLAAAGYEVHTCGSVEEAGAFLDETTVDLIITDYKMPRSNGLELIKYVRDNFRDTEIMMITGYPSISGAVEAMRDGAGSTWPSRSRARSFWPWCGGSWRSRPDGVRPTTRTRNSALTASSGTARKCRPCTH